jgi:hypothetical protein
VVLARSQSGAVAKASALLRSAQQQQQPGQPAASNGSSSGERERKPSLTDFMAALPAERVRTPTRRLSEAGRGI